MFDATEQDAQHCASFEDFNKADQARKQRLTELSKNALLLGKVEEESSKNPVKPRRAN